MAQRSSVLIVERSGELCEVLRTALARRDVRIYEASAADSGLKLAQERRPDLIVLDLDERSGDVADVTNVFASSSGAVEPTPLILLGAVRRRGGTHSDFIAKPYHYGPLISRIEQLLQARSGGGAAKRHAG